MAEVTSQDFQRLLEEQQRTNQLLVEGNKDPSLPSSIKQNLGEILNASRLAGQNEKFQKLTSKKVGRNDPCPCNSGKKYKHCHGSL